MTQRHDAQGHVRLPGGTRPGGGHHGPPFARQVCAGVSQPARPGRGRGYEDEAVLLRHFEPCLIPGLLQTEEYARAVFTAGRLYRPERVEELLSLRMVRQQLLYRNGPPDCVFVIDESALRRSIGGPEVMDRQFRWLLEVAELPQVRLHVLPLDVGAHISMGGGFVIAELPGNEHMLCLDNAARGQIADYPEWVGLMLRKWEILLGEALPERASLELINKLKVTPRLLPHLAGAHRPAPTSLATASRWRTTCPWCW